MLQPRRPWNLLLATSVLTVCLATGRSAIAAPDRSERPVALTVVGLPLDPRAHPSTDGRERITRDLLEILDRHDIRAVVPVHAGDIRDAWDEALLRLWIDAGHELANHSFSHLDYTRTPTPEFIADVERGRETLLPLVRPSGRSVRFFRYPLLHEGETAGKWRAMRDYLSSSKQRKLPVTIDDPGAELEAAWLEARRAGDGETMGRLAENHSERALVEVMESERVADELFGRPVPQILSLGAGELGAASWERLFDRLEASGHRFVSVDDALDDPALRSDPRYVGRAGYTLWGRVKAVRGLQDARQEIRELLETQAAAWNRGDLETFCSVYHEAALFLSPSGTTRGRQQILERYRARYADREAMGTLGLEIVEIELFQGSEPGAVPGATVAARWSLSYPERETASGLTLIVVRRDGERWVIVQDASM